MIGLGYRREMSDWDMSAVQADFFEVAPENWVHRDRAPLHQLIASGRPVHLHGVSLNLGGSSPIDLDFLRAVRELMADLNTTVYSDHLAASGDAHQLYDLFPIPFTQEEVLRVSDRIRQVQDTLGRRIAVENISYYAVPGADMSEIDFITAVLAEADCDLLLDVNNVFVNACNNGYDAFDFLARVPAHRVASLHVAGHFDEDDGFKIDTHGAPVKGVVWALLGEAYARVGVRPTLLERDFNFPPLAELLAEVEQIRHAQADVLLPEVAHG